MSGNFAACSPDIFTFNSLKMYNGPESASNGSTSANPGTTKGITVHREEMFQFLLLLQKIPFTVHFEETVLHLKENDKEVFSLLPYGGKLWQGSTLILTLESA